MTDEKREKIEDLHKLANQAKEANTRFASAFNDFLEMINKNPAGWTLKTADTNVTITKELAGTMKSLFVGEGGFVWGNPLGWGVGSSGSSTSFCLTNAYTGVTVCINYAA